jgi:hypothetical protein
MHKKKNLGLKERLADFEIKDEASKSVNLSLIHLLVVVLAAPDERAECAILLNKWKKLINLKTPQKWITDWNFKSFALIF